MTHPHPHPHPIIGVQPVGTIVTIVDARSPHDGTTVQITARDHGVGGVGGGGAVTVRRTWIGSDQTPFKITRYTRAMVTS